MLTEFIQLFFPIPQRPVGWTGLVTDRYAVCPAPRFSCASLNKACIMAAVRLLALFLLAALALAVTVPHGDQIRGLKRKYP